MKQFLILSILFLFSCKQHVNPVPPSFYHWKGELTLSSLQKSTLQNLKTQKLYLRYFDIDYNPDIKEAVPVGVVKFSDTLNASMEIIPTIFITNSTFKKVNQDEAIKALAQKCITKIEAQSKALNTVIKTLQFDCDWTLSTKEAFFSFLNHVKLISNNKYKLSCTIRLHQFSNYQNTGVPPVSYGVLMCYNMGNLNSLAETNSILNLKETEHYLNQTQGYPIHLDIALPLYSWAVLYRGGKVIKLLNSVDVTDLERNGFVQEKHYYKSTVNGFFNYTSIYKNDIIKIEQITVKDLEKLATLLSTKMKYQNNTEVVYYHLDNSILQNYNYETLQDISNFFN